VFSSLIGLFQQDIKKVIAYSTMSQLARERIDILNMFRHQTICEENYHNNNYNIYNNNKYSIKLNTRNKNLIQLPLCGGINIGEIKFSTSLPTFKGKRMFSRTYTLNTNDNNTNDDNTNDNTSDFQNINEQIEDLESDLYYPEGENTEHKDPDYEKNIKDKIRVLQGLKHLVSGGGENNNMSEQADKLRMLSKHPRSEKYRKSIDDLEREARNLAEPKPPVVPEEDTRGLTEPRPPVVPEEETRGLTQPRPPVPIYSEEHKG